MAQKRLPIDLFGYHDYRQFLHDLYGHLCGCARRFSYRKFAAQAGLSPPNMLKLVLDGKRNLNDTHVARIANAFAFNKSEKHYFGELVRMNQAGTHEERDRHYRALSRYRRYNLLNRESRELHEYYSRWYYPVVREMVTLADFDADPRQVARRVKPSISTDEARRAIALLERIGQIRREGNRWVQCEPTSTTGPEVESLAVTTFHEAMIDRAREAIDSVPHGRRNVSSLTMAVSSETYQEVVREVYGFQQRLIELVNRESRPDEVYQLNFQLFPVTETKNGRNP